MALRYDEESLLNFLCPYIAEGLRDAAILPIRKRQFPMTNYETMYILRPNLGEEDTEQIVETYRTILTENGAEDLDIQHRGKRRLAYEIDRNREGIYIQMNYRAPGAAIAVMQRAMRLSESVLRFLTIKQEPIVPEEETDEAVAR